MPFTVRDFEDLVRLLERHPEWRSQLRRILLTEELLTVPERLAHVERLLAEQAQREQEQQKAVAALLEAVRDNSFQIRELRDTVAEHTRQLIELRTIVQEHTAQIWALRETVEQHTRQLEEHTAQIRELRETVEQHSRQLVQLTEQVQALARSIQILADRLDRVAERGDKTLGMVLELRAEQRLSSWLGRLLRGLRVRPPGEWDRELGTLLGRAEYDRLLDADLIARGRLNGGGDSWIWLVVEVSYVVDGRDVRRAWEWAWLMSEAGLTAVPVVLGAVVTPEARETALRDGVLVVEADLHAVRTEGWERARERWVRSAA
ncbi:MAG: hypothetical protein RMH81_07630 [Thermomicrobium sp.]|nr:hypothetical protein [Thermomicrobium sp.]